MTESPSIVDLEKLPFRAIVAYAVRNARRVQPLFIYASEIKSYLRHCHSIEEAMTLIQRWIIDDSVSAEKLDKIQSKVFDAHYAADYITQVSNYAASYTADAVYRTSWAARDFASGTFNYVARAAHHTSDDAVRAVARATTNKVSFAAARAGIIAAAINDYKKLISLNLIDNNGIDTSENGLLGPYWSGVEEPDWYQELYPKMRSLLDAPYNEEENPYKSPVIKNKQVFKTDFLEKLTTRPGMYWGDSNNHFQSLQAFIAGYDQAKHIDGDKVRHHTNIIPSHFLEFVTEYFGLTYPHGGYGWMTFIKENSSSDFEAFELFLWLRRLYDEQGYGENKDTPKP